MRRRTFLHGGTALAVTGSAAPQSPVVPGSPTRLSSLFDKSTVSPHTSVQYILPNGDQYVCLYHDRTKRQFGLASSTFNGDIVWKHDLPKGVYLSLGLHQGSILLHALYYFTDVQQAAANRLLRFDPASGNLTPVGKVALGGSTTMLRFAGDSLLIRITESNRYEIWRVADSEAAQVAEGAFTDAMPKDHWVELLATGIVAVISLDGTSLGLITVPTGSQSVHRLSSSEIDRGRAAYEERNSKYAVGSGKLPRSLIIPAVGSDRMGTLYALVSPFEQGIASVIKVDQSATISSAGKWLVPRRSHGGFGVPQQLLIRESEAGVAFGDGNVVWYAGDYKMMR